MPTTAVGVVVIGGFSMTGSTGRSAAVVSSTLTTVVVFAPLALLTGVTGTNHHNLTHDSGTIAPANALGANASSRRTPMKNSGIETPIMAAVVAV